MCSSSRPWRRIPPPTHSIAAVPIADSALSSFGTICDQRVAESAGGAVAALGHVQADVVELHDQRDDAIDARR